MAYKDLRELQARSVAKDSRLKEKVLDVRFSVDNPDEWTLLTEYWREVYLDDGSRHLVWVPAGFKTDMASVPRPFWSLIPRWGRYAGASVIHDYLYDKRIGTRKEADDIFLKLMLEDGVPKDQAEQMYLAVRAFGGSVWHD